MEDFLRRIRIHKPYDTEEERDLNELGMKVSMTCSRYVFIHLSQFVLNVSLKYIDYSVDKSKV